MTAIKSSVDVSETERCDQDEVASWLLHLCLRVPWDPSALESARKVAVQRTVAWKTLFDIACSGGMAPLFYSIVRGQGLLPPAVEDEFRLIYFGSARRNVRLFHDLEGVLRRLSTVDVPVLLLKGTALAESVYANHAVRPVRDSDLLVREKDVPTALQVIEGLGYEIVPPRAYRAEVVLRSPSGSLPIELHWNLFVLPHYRYLISADWLWQTAVLLSIGETEAYMLGPVAQLLHLCGHLYLHHSGGEAQLNEARLLRLYDVAMVVVRYREALDWEMLLEQAVACDLALPVQRVLAWMNQAWGVSIPAAVLEKLNTLTPSCSETRVFSRLAAPRRSAIRRLWDDTMDIPSWRWRLHFMWQNLFPPVDYVRQIYHVRYGLLLPLYYLYRWCLGVYGILTARRTHRRSL